MMKTNRLINESSLYLRQHAHNPVDWYPWGDEVLERARREKRLIFLSIGYSSCHWCHVMERESFEDPETARLLNTHFINIKVDREERPDVDAVYMEALQMMTGRGGWPLNIWLTPEQVPIFAGTYFPPQDYHGRPSFTTVIRRLADAFRQYPEKVQQQAAEMRKALNSDIYDRLKPAALSGLQLDRAFQAHAQNYDPIHGGFSEAPKFPMAMSIGFLLRYGHKPGKPESAPDPAPTRTRSDTSASPPSPSDPATSEAHQMALHSLEKMICGGIYDQAGGGFHRYSTDGEWLVPHFEKMLYDNALLIPVMAEAAQLTGTPLFRDAVEETIGFLNREMRHQNGAYYTALDADTDGVEGKFYTFSFRELEELLEPDLFRLAADRFGLTPGGNWEGVNILHRAAGIGELAADRGSSTESIHRKLEKIKEAIRNYRNKRTRPGLDDKIITSWNALMLIALCHSSRSLGRSDDDAVRLGDFLTRHALSGDTLYRIIDNHGTAKQPGFLDDYALLTDGFTRLFEITGDPARLELAVQLTERMLDLFFDRDKNAFRYSARGQAPLVSETRDVFDNAMPGGNSAAIAALYRAGHLAGRPEWIRTAVTAMEPLSEIAAEHATAFGYLLQTMHRHIHPGNEIVIVCPPESTPETDPVAKKMAAIWREYYDPSSYLVTIAGNTSFKGTAFEALYGDKQARNGQTTAYICRDFECRAPVHSPEMFREKIVSSR
ncbi:thioredoxin domain-containing protein [Balneolales bacterium ANBcel1]|nr:thioredoxin domain-containing protein [Balneolales bacterium ANBcel1]